MFSIGLTGGIGSGKTQVADWLEQWGATVVDTDQIAHALTAVGGQAIEPLRQAFGPAAITAEGCLDRDWMRERVFSDTAARRQLEAILHPLIGQSLEEQAAQAKGVYRVYVVPLLVEAAHWRDRVDRICVVDCDPATQIRRVQSRSGLTPEAIERIMSAQASREDRLAVADDIIVNDGVTDLETLRQRSLVCHQSWSDLASRSLRGSAIHD